MRGDLRKGESFLGLFFLGVNLFLIGLTPFLFFAEALNATFGINIFHFAGKEGMTGGANFYLYFGQSGAGAKLVATSTGDLAIVVVFRMDTRFHTGVIISVFT